MRTTNIYVGLIAILALSLFVSCKKQTPVPPQDPFQAKILSYMERTIDVDLSSGVTRVEVPVWYAFVNPHLIKAAPRVCGKVALDQTTAIENVHFAIPTIIHDMGRPLSDTSTVFYIKLYPERITEDVTITMVGSEFRGESIFGYHDRVIDTVTINLRTPR